MIKKKTKVWRYFLLWLFAIFFFWYGLYNFFSIKDDTRKPSQKDVVVSSMEVIKPKITEPYYDFTTNTSITRYVWKDIDIWLGNYEPQLVEIIPSSILKVINEKWNYHKLSEDAYIQLKSMAKDFYDNFKKPIVIYSAYRSYDYQKNSISTSCKNSWYCAKEWESEHQLGLAIDLWETTNNINFIKKYDNYYQWLKENAHKYWFHQSYQKWVSIDWYHEEPWHWRYLGVEMATYLHKNDMTYTEFWSIKR